MPLVEGGEKGLRRWSVGTLSYTRAGLVALFSWLLWGDFAWWMKERAITPVAQIMLRNFAAPDWVVGLLVASVPAALGIFIGPLISVRSDRRRGRWGRRIPYLLISTPIITLSMIGLAATPMFGTWLHGYLGVRSPGLMACRVMVFGGVWTAFETTTVIVNALFGALVNDVVPHSVIGRFYSLFRAVSLIAGIIFNYYLIGNAKAHYSELLIGLGLIYGAAFAVMCLKIKEGGYPPPPLKEHRSSAAAIFSTIMLYVKECYSNPFYRCFFLATILGSVTLVPVNAFSVFHARSVGLSDDLYGKCIALSYAISLLASYPIGILADRFHPIRLGIVSMIFYAGLMLASFFLATTRRGFFVAFSIHAVAAGAYLTGTASIAQRLLPALRFAQLLSAGAIILAVCNVILPPALGAFIQIMHHEYRYVFAIASVLAVLSAAVYTALLAKYNRLGGDRSFIPP